MTEFEKMRNSELYDFSNKEGMKSIEHANRLCCRLQTLTLFDEDYRTIIEELIPSIPASATICPPFTATMVTASRWVRMYSSTMAPRCLMKP